MSALKRIKVWLNFARMAPAELLARANTVYTRLSSNLEFTNLPFDLVEFKAEIDGYSASIVDALDGSKTAIAERKRRGEVVIEMLLQLAHYVEAKCKGNMALFLLSGFEPAPTARTATPPLCEAIRSIRRGPNRGQSFVKLVAQKEAFSYQLRWAVTREDDTPGDWTIVPVANTRPATLVTDLKPGGTYLFQARAVVEDGYTDWSDSVTYICT